MSLTESQKQRFARVGKQMATTTAHLPALAAARKLYQLTEEEKSRMWVRSANGKLKIKRSLSFSKFEEHSWSMPVVRGANGGSGRALTTRQKRKQQKNLTVARSFLLTPEQQAKERERDEAANAKLTKSKKEKKERRDKGLGDSADKAAAAAAAAAPTIAAPPSPQPGEASPVKERRDKREKKEAALSASVKSADGAGPERRRTDKPHTTVAAPTVVPEASKRLSLQLPSPALQPPLTASVNPARSPRQTMKPGSLTQEQQNAIKAGRLVELGTTGIEIGSFAGGSPLILAGTLPKIVEKLSTWIVSGQLDAQSSLQINGFLMTYECFVTHDKLLQCIVDLYHQAHDATLPEASREKFAKRKREGLLKFLHAWLNDKSLSPHHRHFIREASFASAVKAFVAQLSAEERESTAVAELCMFLASPDHRPQSRADAGRLLTDEELAKLPPKGSGIAGLFGKRINSVADFEFLELNPRSVAEQLTQLDYDRFLDLDPYDLVYLTWAKKEPPPDNTITLLANKSKHLTRWIASEIISTSNPSKRVEVMCRVIAIVEQLYLANNFQSMMNVLSGLNHGAVLRLNKTWGKLSANTKKTYDKLTNIVAQFSAYKVYRKKLLKRMELGEPVVPCVDVILRDVTLADENPRFVDDNKKFINFDKCMWYVNYLEALKPARVVRYPIDHRDETQVDRLLRKFLNAPTPAFSDEELYNLSLKIEPRAKAQL